MVSWRAALAPDLALLAAAAALFYCLVAWDGPRRLFRDADSGWHIRTGERILAERALPRSDPYSFSRAGDAWVAWEWGADLLMGCVHRIGGLGGVAWLYACAIAAAVWAWFRLSWLVGGNFWIACAMAPPMLSTTNLHWLARPHVLGWLMALAAVWQAERAGLRFTRGDGLRIFLGSALWANLHGSFFLAPLIALLYAAGHWLRPRLWELDAASEAARTRWFLKAAAAAALGTLVNPYGWRLHWHVARYLTDGELLARIGEFQSFNFHAEGAGQVLLCVGLAAVGTWAVLTQRRVAHFLLLGFLLASALRMARGLPLVALLGLPLANGAFTAALTRAAADRDLRGSLRRRLQAFLEYSQRLRAIDARYQGAVPGVALAVLALLWVQTPAVAARAGFAPEQFPVAAADRLELLPGTVRLLCTDKYGGYLIYRFQGRLKVFFDGRSDFYGAEFLKQYGRLMQLRPGWRRQLQRYGFTHALLPADSPLAAALEDAGWRRVYADRTAVLLERWPAGFVMGWRTSRGGPDAPRKEDVWIGKRLRSSSPWRCWRRSD